MAWLTRGACARPPVRRQCRPCPGCQARCVDGSAHHVALGTFNAPYRSIHPVLSRAGRLDPAIGGNGISSPYPPIEEVGRSSRASA